MLLNCSANIDCNWDTDSSKAATFGFGTASIKRLLAIGAVGVWRGNKARDRRDTFRKYFEAADVARPVCLSIEASSESK